MRDRAACHLGNARGRPKGLDQVVLALKILQQDRRQRIQRRRDHLERYRARKDGIHVERQHGLHHFLQQKAQVERRGRARLRGEKSLQVDKLRIGDVLVVNVDPLPLPAQKVRAIDCPGARTVDCVKCVSQTVIAHGLQRTAADTAAHSSSLDDQPELERVLPLRGHRSRHKPLAKQIKRLVRRRDGLRAGAAGLGLVPSTRKPSGCPARVACGRHRRREGIIVAIFVDGLRDPRRRRRFRRPRSL
mmetsp:Transcript_1413/g.4566  ORF Transcript_1413/g.4566 Transcript_1413/m.4566 type:complete len:246 (+) Transcript_1413:3087-3824(+)